MLRLSTLCGGGRGRDTAIGVDATRTSASSSNSATANAAASGATAAVAATAAALPGASGKSAASAAAATATATAGSGGKPSIPSLPLHSLLQGNPPPHSSSSSSSAAAAAEADDVGGPLGTPGFVDGDFAQARFNSPSHLTLAFSSDDAERGGAPKAVALFVSDQGNHAIRKVDLVSRTVSTIVCRESHRPTTATATGGSGTAAPAASLAAVAPSKAAIVSSASSSAAAGPPAAATTPSQQPLPLFLPLSSPAGLVLDPQSSGSYILVCDGGNHLVRKIVLPSCSTTNPWRAASAVAVAKATLWAGGDDGKLGWENEGEDEVPDDADTALAPTSTAASALSDAASQAAPRVATPPQTSRRRMATEARLAEEDAAAAAAAVGEQKSSSSSSRPSTASSASSSSSSRSALVPAPTAALPSIPALVAKFSHPSSLCWDASSNVIIVDRGNRRLKRVGPTGRLQHVQLDPTAQDNFELRFQAPECVIEDGRGNLIVSDPKAHCVRRVSLATGCVSILAGNPRSQGGFRDGVGTQARFRSPFGLALEPKSNAVFVSDEENHCVRIVSARGKVRTLAGGGRGGGVQASSARGSITSRPMSASTHRSYSGRPPPPPAPAAAEAASMDSTADGAEEEAEEPEEGFLDGSGLNARFFRPRGLAFDPHAQVLYVADAGNHAIRVLRFEDATEEGGGGFDKLMADDPFPTARLMPGASAASPTPASAVSGTATSRSSSSLNRYASMPSFPHSHSSSTPLTARGFNGYGNSVPPTTSAGRPGSSSGSGSGSNPPLPLSSLGRKAASSSLALSALHAVALPPDPRTWSRVDVSFWLVGVNVAFESYVEGFWHAGIDGKALMEKINDALLAAPLSATSGSSAGGVGAGGVGIGISSKTHRNTIMREILRLKNPGEDHSTTTVNGNDAEDAEESSSLNKQPFSSSEGNHNSRGSSASAGSTRPQTAAGGGARPTTAGAWRPPSAHLSAAAETFVTGLHLEALSMDPNASPAAASSSSSPLLPQQQRQLTPSPPPHRRPSPSTAAVAVRAMDVPASSSTSAAHAPQE